MSHSNNQLINHLSNQSLEKIKQVIIYSINILNNRPSNHLSNQYLEQSTK